MAKKKNCWEVKKCGREPGGANVAAHGVCPSSVDASANGLNSGEYGGRICWAIAGTFCGEKVQGTFAKERLSCLTCEFFKMVRQEEGESKFHLLKPGQVYKASVK